MHGDKQQKKVRMNKIIISIYYYIKFKRNLTLKNTNITMSMLVKNVYIHSYV